MLFRSRALQCGVSSERAGEQRQSPNYGPKRLPRKETCGGRVFSNMSVAADDEAACMSLLTNRIHRDRKHLQLVAEIISLDRETVRVESIEEEQDAWVEPDRVPCPPPTLEREEENHANPGQLVAVDSVVALPDSYCFFPNAGPTVR